MSIEDFEKLSDFAKKRLIARSELYDEICEKENEVYKGSRKAHSIVFIAEDIAVLIDDKPTWPEAPFTFALKKADEWKHSNSYYASHEIAYLAALSEKHIGADSDFALFASRILEMD